jgi:hypothetical protein
MKSGGNGAAALVKAVVPAALNKKPSNPKQEKLIEGREAEIQLDGGYFPPSGLKIGFGMLFDTIGGKRGALTLNSRIFKTSTGLTDISLRANVEFGDTFIEKKRSVVTALLAGAGARLSFAKFLKKVTAYPIEMYTAVDVLAGYRFSESKDGEGCEIRGEWAFGFALPLVIPFTNRRKRLTVHFDIIRVGISFMIPDKEKGPEAIIGTAMSFELHQ